jgi:putative peptidoglycan lipid II flippase
VIGDRRRVGGTGRSSSPGQPRARHADPPSSEASQGSRLQRATVGMAAGTTISRLTGLFRVVALAYFLGSTHLADAYNLANTTPNMLYDIVLGGVLAATFIPVFVDRLATRDEHEAWRAISAVISIAAVVLVAMTVVFWALAPQVIDAYTALDHVTRGTVGRLAAEKAVASTLLRWFVPQVALYGFIALVSALLNTRRRFAAPMWVPIANNLVVIGVLLWFHTIVPKAPSLATAHAHPDQLVLLGIGTTAGVALQALMLLPSLRGVGLGRLRWLWDPRHEAVRTVMRLGGWTFGFVVANQVALYVVLALAVTAPGADPVSSYTYAYTFMQMPYAVVAVSIMSAVTPDLSERWATGDLAGFRRRLTAGLRATLAVILPAAVGLLILAKPAAALLLGHGGTTIRSADGTGTALAMFALGLPGFCAYLYIVRVLQSMQRTKVAFWLYVVENGINIVLAVALVRPLGVRGLALSLSVGYTVGALMGVVVLRRWLGALGTPGAWAPMRRVAGASIAMGVAVLLVSNVSSASHGVGLLVRVGAAVIAGVVVYVGLAVVMSGWSSPMALLTGGSLDATGAADRRNVGAGAGLGAAWGDTRVPVNPGPRIRIVPPPGSPVPPVPGAALVARSSEPPVGTPGPRPGPREGPTPVPTPANPGRSIGPTLGLRNPSAHPQPRTTPGAPSGPPTAIWPPAGSTGPASGQRPEEDNADDPGERRWIGGTGTRRSRPR